MTNEMVIRLVTSGLVILALVNVAHGQSPPDCNHQHVRNRRAIAYGGHYERFYSQSLPAATANVGGIKKKGSISSTWRIDHSALGTYSTSNRTTVKARSNNVIAPTSSKIFFKVIGGKKRWFMIVTVGNGASGNTVSKRTVLKRSSSNSTLEASKKSATKWAPAQTAPVSTSNSPQSSMPTANGNGNGGSKSNNKAAIKSSNSLGMSNVKQRSGTTINSVASNKAPLSGRALNSWDMAASSSSSAKLSATQTISPITSPSWPNNNHKARGTKSGLTGTFHSSPASSKTNNGANNAVKTSWAKKGGDFGTKSSAGTKSSHHN